MCYSLAHGANIFAVVTIKAIYHAKKEDLNYRSAVFNWHCYNVRSEH